MTQDDARTDALESIEKTSNLRFLAIETNEAEPVRLTNGRARRSRPRGSRSRPKPEPDRLLAGTEHGAASAAGLDRQNASTTSARPARAKTTTAAMSPAARSDPASRSIDFTVVRYSEPEQTWRYGFVEQAPLGDRCRNRADDMQRVWIGPVQDSARDETSS